MKCSVIIPVYNAEATLARAVDSCLLQGEAVGEILIVDNNSTDGSAVVAAAYVDRYPEFVWLVPEARQGSSAARNAGLDLAEFEWIQFLDADDELLAGKIERQFGLINDDVDWVIGQWATIERGRTHPAAPLAADPWKGFVFNGGLGNTNSNLYRKSALSAVGNFSESLVNGEDMDLYLKLLQAEVGWVHDPIAGSVYHLDEGDSLSQERPLPLAIEELDRKVNAVDWLALHRPDYFTANKAFFYSATLRGVRRVYTFDDLAGRAAFQKYFPNGIDHSLLDPALMPGYFKAYKIMGFDRIERLRSFFRNHFR
ncbi:glycosyltransferase [Lewinella sp. 4G2]|uniref:glycosyltransferase family 2 protein n=1 Tax=Lewinella sp. 4G2 TaxID=1803372 RepID=UPI0007B4EBD1|nr:glycosyltransferase [Lewinella sp. 4G2]OAV46193.1 hypothetical protein A3850_018210 [Lewinella sp. 4G2]